MKKNLSIVLFCASLSCYASETKNSSLTQPSKSTQLTEEYGKKTDRIAQLCLTQNNNSTSRLDLGDTSSQTLISTHKKTLLTDVQNSPSVEQERNQLAKIKQFEDAERRVRKSMFDPLHNSPYRAKKSFSQPITTLAPIPEVDENDQT
jgi:hypothetical protein